jgi:ribonuclease HI
MVKRYYAMIDANTGKTDVRHEEWDNIKTEFQSKSSLIYKVFNTEKEANDFINQGYIEESDIDPDDNEAVNKEIEDRIASLTDDEAIIATDGSYMEDVNKDIAGAGWIEITKDHKEPKNDTCAPEGMRNVAGKIKAIEKLSLSPYINYGLAVKALNV